MTATKLPSEAVRKGDVNGDGVVNAADRTYLARFLAVWGRYML